MTYWLYRPAIGWAPWSAARAPHESPPDGIPPLLEATNPRLVPLETLAGRNHYDFPADEEPPWRWRVEGVYPG